MNEPRDKLLGPVSRHHDNITAMSVESKSVISQSTQGFPENDGEFSYSLIVPTYLRSRSLYLLLMTRIGITQSGDLTPTT